MLFSGTCIPVDLASLCMFCSNSIPGCARFYWIILHLHVHLELQVSGGRCHQAHIHNRRITSLLQFSVCVEGWNRSWRDKLGLEVWRETLQVNHACKCIYIGVLVLSHFNLSREELQNVQLGIGIHMLEQNVAFGWYHYMILQLILVKTVVYWDSRT